MNYIAWDCETELIKERKVFKLKQRKVRLEPYEPPTLVLMSSYDGKASQIFSPEDAVVALNRWMDEGYHFVLHNASFDVWVMARQNMDLGMRLLAYAGEGKIHDTMWGDLLLRLYKGEFDKPTYPDFKLLPMHARSRPGRSLANLAQHYCGIELDKDPSVRTGFGQYKGRLDEMPPSFKEYAEQDAVATYRVWEKMLAHMPGSWGVFGDFHTDERLLSEPLQTRASLAIAAMDFHGVKVDREEAVRLKGIFEKDMPALEEALVAGGLGEWCPMGGVSRSKHDYEEDTTGHCWDVIQRWSKLGWVRLDDGSMCRHKAFKIHFAYEKAPASKFHLFTKKVRQYLSERIVPHMHKPPKLTDTGLLSLDADFWAEHIPDSDEVLKTWQRRQKLQKILDTYLYLYSQVDEVYPNWNTMGARSGRMSCSSPNIQNIPKRKHGIRAVFVPHDGMVFVKADYTTQELFTLAEVMKHRGIDGPLLRAIRDGTDLHKFTASLLTGKPIDEITKEERQAAKVTNFGVPGGLGPKKIADTAKRDYGLEWSVDEAKDIKRKYLRKFWDIDEYLRTMQTGLNANLIRVSQRGCAYWANEIGVQPGYTLMELKKALQEHPSPAIRKMIMEAERNNVVELPCGRIRTGCLFTEAANTGFQGPASDITKQANYRCLMAGIRAVIVVHDEIVIECYPDQVEFAKAALERCMLGAFMDMCEYVGAYAKVEVEGPLDRWGPAKDKDGKEI